jgi:glycosyltransferase involved in cell wall biosynthesis
MISVPIDRKIKPLSNLVSIYRLYRLMKKEKYDIVHVHTPIASVLGRIAAKLAGVKHIIYTAHGFYFHEGMPKVVYLLFYYVEKLCARWFTDWLLLQSKEDYELSLNKNFKKKDRILHIGNGVDIYSKFNLSSIPESEVRKLKKDFHLTDDHVVFAFVGRLVKEKGIFELIQAFRQLKRTTSNVKLLVIGDVHPSERDQKSAQELKKLLEDDDIIATGFRLDIPALLAISDVFVLPSHREGLPRSIIEAMALCKPIIATNIRGCREEVIDGENGFLVEKANVQQLFERMYQLANDRALRERFGKRSREIVEKFFDERKVIDIQLALFEQLS